MTDRNRPTLRLRMPAAGPGPDGPPRRQPLGAPPASAPVPGRPGAYAVAVPRPQPAHAAKLDDCSRAILDELSALGLADAPEPP